MKPSTAQPLPRETSRQRGGRQVRKTRPNLDHRFRRHAGLVLLLQLARPRPWLHSGGDSTVRGPGYDQLRLRRDPLPPGETVGPIRRHQGGDASAELTRTPHDPSRRGTTGPGLASLPGAAGQDLLAGRLPELRGDGGTGNRGGDHRRPPLSPGGLQGTPPAGLGAGRYRCAACLPYRRRRMISVAPTISTVPTTVKTKTAWAVGSPSARPSIRRTISRMPLLSFPAVLVWTTPRPAPCSLCRQYFGRRGGVNEGESEVGFASRRDRSTLTVYTKRDRGENREE